jgi:hypothetical protein
VKSFPRILLCFSPFQLHCTRHASHTCFFIIHHASLITHQLLFLLFRSSILLLYTYSTRTVTGEIPKTRQSMPVPTAQATEAARRCGARTSSVSMSTRASRWDPWAAVTASHHRFRWCFEAPCSSLSRTTAGLEPARGWPAGGGRWPPAGTREPESTPWLRFGGILRERVVIGEVEVEGAFRGGRTRVRVIEERGETRGESLRGIGGEPFWSLQKRPGRVCSLEV